MKNPLEILASYKVLHTLNALISQSQTEILLELAWIPAGVFLDHLQTALDRNLSVQILTNKLDYRTRNDTRHPNQVQNIAKLEKMNVILKFKSYYEDHIIGIFDKKFALAPYNDYYSGNYYSEQYKSTWVVTDDAEFLEIYLDTFQQNFAESLASN